MEIFFILIIEFNCRCPSIALMVILLGNYCLLGDPISCTWLCLATPISRVHGAAAAVVVAGLEEWLGGTSDWRVASCRKSPQARHGHSTESLSCPSLWFPMSQSRIVCGISCRVDCMMHLVQAVLTWGLTLIICVENPFSAFVCEIGDNQLCCLGIW